MMPLRDRDLTALLLGAGSSLFLPTPYWGLGAALLLPVARYCRPIPLLAGLIGLLLGAINGVLWHEARLPEACISTRANGHRSHCDIASLAATDGRSVAGEC